MRGLGLGMQGLVGRVSVEGLEDSVPLGQGPWVEKTFWCDFCIEWVSVWVLKVGRDAGGGGGVGGDMGRKALHFCVHIAHMFIPL